MAQKPAAQPLRWLQTLFYQHLTCATTMSSSFGGLSRTSSQRSTAFDDLSPCGTSSLLVTSHPPTSGMQFGICDHGLTYSNHAFSAAEHQRQYIQQQMPGTFPTITDPIRPRVPSRRCRMNMNVTVDLEGILPEQVQDLRTGQPMLNLDSIPILTFFSDSQLYNTNVDYIKQAIQELCWECFRIPIRKRDFKLWLQVIPPHSPSFPYGKFEPLDFDNFWIEVLNSHQIPFAQERLHLQASCSPS